MPRVLGQGRVMYGTVLYHFGDSVLCWDHHHFKEFRCLKVLLVVKPSAILIVPIVVFCHTPFLSALCAALCIMQALGVLQNNFTTIGRGVCMYVCITYGDKLPKLHSRSRTTARMYVYKGTRLCAPFIRPQLYICLHASNLYNDRENLIIRRT